jgi:hypothetical protein
MGQEALDDINCKTRASSQLARIVMDGSNRITCMGVVSILSLIMGRRYPSLLATYHHIGGSLS